MPRDYNYTFARLSDLPSIHALYADHFGEEVPSIDLMRSWLSRCKTCFALVNRVVRRNGLVTEQQLVGSFKLLPLTKAGIEAIERGTATGSSFRPEHISTNKKRSVVAYYVGDVVGTTRRARGMVILYLRAACNDIQLPLYARPLTEDGVRVMMKYGFTHISNITRQPEIGRMCKREGKAATSKSFVD